jgi:hypothetical protein
MFLQSILVLVLELDYLQQETRARLGKSLLQPPETDEDNSTWTETELSDADTATDVEEAVVPNDTTSFRDTLATVRMLHGDRPLSSKPQKATLVFGLP